MNVVDLGQFGPKRPSPYEGLAHAMNEGAKTGVAQGESLERIASLQHTMAYQQQELKMKQQELALNAKGKDLEEKKQTMEQAKEVYNHLVVETAGMSPQQIAEFTQTKQFEAARDFVQKGLGDSVVKQDGTLIGMGDKEKAFKIVADKATASIKQTQAEALVRHTNNNYGYLYDPNKSDAENRAIMDAQRQRDDDAMNSLRVNQDLYPSTSNLGLDKGKAAQANEAANTYAIEAGKKIASHIAAANFDIGKVDPQALHNDLFSLSAKSQPLSGGPDNVPTVLSQGMQQPAAAPTSAQPMAPQAGVPAQGGGSTSSASNDPYGLRQGV